MYVIIHFLNNIFENFILLIKVFLIQIFFNDYNLMENHIFTLVKEKKNIFKGKKFYLTNIPFNLRKTKKFKFKENIKFTGNIKNKSQNNILILDVKNLYDFSNKYFEYDSYNIFYNIDILNLKKDFGGIFFFNQNYSRNLFEYKFIWFFSEKNFSGYLFHENLIY